MTRYSREITDQKGHFAPEKGNCIETPSIKEAPGLSTLTKGPFFELIHLSTLTKGPFSELIHC